MYVCVCIHISNQGLVFTYIRDGQFRSNFGHFSAEFTSNPDKKKKNTIRLFRCV